MRTFLSKALILATFSIASGLMTATPIVARGAPQAVGCANAEGKLDGNVCNLPDGRGCQAMHFAQFGECLSEAGDVLLPPDAEIEDANGTAPDSGSGDSGSDSNSE